MNKIPMRNMKDINTVLVAFSATSIHKKLAKAALDMAEENNAKLIILSVRDKNVTQMVAKVTKDHGFLGRDVVEKLAEDIKKDRDELIEHRLARIEEEAERRGIEFETLQVKGNFNKNIIEVAEKYAVDVVLVDGTGSKMEQIERKIKVPVHLIK